MAKRIIKCQVNDEYVVGSGVPIGAAGSHDDVVLRLEFNDSWIGLNIYATFRDARGENPTVVLLLAPMLLSGTDMTYEVTVPAAAKFYAGKAMLTLTGYTVDETGAQETSATNTATAYFPVLPSDYAFAEDGSIDATIAQQLQGGINDLDGRVTENEKDIAALGDLGGRVTENESDISGLETDVSDLMHEVYDSDGKVEKLISDVSGNEERIGVLEREVGELAARDENIDSKIDTLESDMTEKASILDEKINTLEAKHDEAVAALAEKLGTVGTIEFKIVTELPTEDIAENAIYLVPAVDGAEPDLFDEYIFTNGAWEKLGSAAVSVDLSEYVKRQEYNKNVTFQGSDGSAMASAYVTSYSGKQTTMPVANQNTPFTIVARASDGNFYVSDPKLKWNAANKNYVDNTIAAAIAAITDGEEVAY